MSNSNSQTKTNSAKTSSEDVSNTQQAVDNAGKNQAANQNNYQVFARKYRPANFKDLKGQDILVQTLTNAIKHEKLAHAFILTGIRGIGKTTTARIIAATINCQQPVNEENLILPCGKCASCQAVAKENHPDIIEFDAASNTSVEDIKEIIAAVSYKPLLSKYKIYIIDEVHMLSKSAFNAFLKTLEEPPAHVKFIFATTEIRKVPVTIISRCQKFDLKRFTEQEIANLIQSVCDAEKITYEKEALKLLSFKAEGSARDALSLLDRICASLNAEKLDLKQVTNLLGVSDSNVIYNYIESLSKADIKQLLEITKQVHVAGADLNQFLEDLLTAIASIAKYKMTDEFVDYASEDIKEKIANLADEFSVTALQIIWQICLKGRAELLNSFNQLLSAEMLAIKLAHAANLPAPKSILAGLESTNDLATPRQA